MYDVIHPETKKSCSKPARGWRWKEETMKELLDQDLIIFGKDESKTPQFKRYLHTMGTDVQKSLIQNNENGENEVRELFDSKSSLFEHPKPTGFLAEIIGGVQLLEEGEKFILDFFAGSSSSAHAVLILNGLDYQARKFIQVQIPEEVPEKSEAFKLGYRYICEIGKERIRRAAEKIKVEQEDLVKRKRNELKKYSHGQQSISINEKIHGLEQEINNLEESLAKLDFGFRAFRLDESNMQDVYYRPQDYKQEALDLFADNVKPDRTPEDLLTQVMLDWGLPLSLKIERIQVVGKEVFKVAGNSLYACFEKGINEDFAKAIAAEQPLRIVFRDNGFANDTAKINVKQLLKQLSPETEMKVI